MARFSETIRVSATPAEAFALVTDQDRVADWNDHVQRVEVVGGGPVQNGTQLRQHRRRNNRDFVLEFEITHHEPPRRHVVAGTVFGVATTMTFTVEPAPNAGCNVTMAADVHGKWFGRLLAPLVAKEMHKSTRAALQQLKVLLEP